MSFSGKSVCIAVQSVTGYQKLRSAGGTPATIHAIAMALNAEAGAPSVIPSYRRNSAISCLPRSPETAIWTFRLTSSFCASCGGSSSQAVQPCRSCAQAALTAPGIAVLRRAIRTVHSLCLYPAVGSSRNTLGIRSTSRGLRKQEADAKIKQSWHLHQRM